MLTKQVLASVGITPIAIADKELSGAESFTIRTFEICTICGARYWIGYFGTSSGDEKSITEMEEWPRRVTELLGKDHRQNRCHKPLVEIDI